MVLFEFEGEVKELRIQTAIFSVYHVEKVRYSYTAMLLLETVKMHVQKPHIFPSPC